MNALTKPEATAVVAHTPTPAALLQMAIQQGADLDRLERLMALQERWESAQAQKAYNEAFASFKAQAVHIVRNRKVTDGPLKGKSYAELFTVVNAVTPALSAHGLSASWKLTKDEKDWIEVTCILKHAAGHSESVSMGGPPDDGGAKNKIMARASTISYLERYTLKAITGLAEQNDDDDGSGGAPSAEEETALLAFREAAMKGEAALRKHYEDNVPSEAFWQKHAKALKTAATAADRAGAQK